MSLGRHWKIGLCLVAIFAAGAVTGAMLTVRMVKAYIARQATLDRWAGNAMKDYQKKLDLTPAQAEKLKPVFEEAAKELREIRSNTTSNTIQVLRKMNEDVSRDLTPEQQKKLDEIKREFVARLRAQHNAKLPRDGN